MRKEDVEDGLLIVHQTKSAKVRRVPLTRAIQEELRLRVGWLVPYSEQASGAFCSIVKREWGCAVPRAPTPAHVRLPLAGEQW